MFNDSTCVVETVFRSPSSTAYFASERFHSSVCTKRKNCIPGRHEGLFSVVVGPLLPIAMLPNHTWYLLDYSPFVHLSV